MVLNVACVLAQWHEAALLCKGKKSTAGIVPCGGVLLYRASVIPFVAVFAGSETISNTLLCGARAVTFVLTLWVFLKRY